MVSFLSMMTSPCVRAAISVTAALLMVASAGCPDKDRHASIEQMNEGIRKAQVSSFTVAIQHLQEAVKLYPENHLAWYNLGQVYYQDSKLEEAVAAFGDAVKLKSEQPMYQMRLGVALFDSGNPSMASSHLQKSVELEPSLYRAHWYLGRIYYLNDEPKKAAEAYSRAAELNPSWGPPFVSLGKLYLLWDKIPEAIQVLEQGGQHVLDVEEQTDVFYHLGLAYDAQKNWDKAIEAYSKAIDARSNNLDARFQRGLAYAQKGDKSKAREDLQEYVKTGADAFNKQEANKALMTLIAE